MSSEWKMAKPKERFQSHLQVIAVRERQVGEVTQVIEQVKIQPTNAYERPMYRMLEIEGDEVRVLKPIAEVLKEARTRFDKRAKKAAATLEP